MVSCRLGFQISRQLNRPRREIRYTIYRAMCNETTILDQANTKRLMIVYNFNWLTDHRNIQEKDTRLFNTGVSFKLLSMCT